MAVMDGKVVLVTGGGSGIGRGVVETFRAEGASVGVLELSAQKCADLAGLGGGVLVVEGDATSMEDNRRAVAETLEAFGGRLDALVCCVGLWDYFASLLDLPGDRIGEAFDELFAVNVKSNILSVKAAAPTLIESEGNVVLTISNAGFYAGGGGPLYTASKFAVRGLVTQLAYELSPKVRVNAVAPGGTPTELRGLKSLGTDGMAMKDVPDIEDLIRGSNPLHVVTRAADHAWSYLFLAMREWTVGVTGTIINADGGMGVRGVGSVSGLPEEAAALN